jgi:DNA-directed RNA polymerase subunit RPC12/RpoP
MGRDEVLVVLLDPGGAELARYAAPWPERLRAGQELWLPLGGREMLVRALGEVTGEGGLRVARVMEIRLACPSCWAALLDGRGRAALEEDEDGDFVVCPGCGRRVAIERIASTPPGGPVRIRVAADQHAG